MLQVSRFHTGGFVLHKVRVGRGVYSAWYDAAGALLDAERKLPGGRTRSVSFRESGVRDALTVVGKSFARAK